MEKTAIVTGGTHKDVTAIGVLALNLKDIMPNVVGELIVFHDGISKKDQVIIKNIFPTRFIYFRFKLKYHDRRANRSLRYFSSMVFCKYECFRLLTEYDRVIWTDYDIVIRKSLAELLISPSGFQLIEDRAPLRQMFLDDAQCISGQGYDIDKRGILASLFVLTKQVGDYLQYYEWCRLKTQEYASFIDLPEQCIISMLIQKYNLDFEKLPAEKYSWHPRSGDSTASIFHATGRPKFWEGLKNEHWEKYYEEWIYLGGSKYRKPLKEILIKYKAELFGKHL